MSHTERTPSRRRLLAGATAVLAAGAAIATSARPASVASPDGAGDDAELIRLCVQQDEAWGAVLAIQSEKRPAGVPPGITQWSEDKEHRLADADDEYLTLVEMIARTPAMTAASLPVKAQVMLGVLERVVVGDIGGKTLDDIANGDAAQIEDRLSLSLARDVLAIAGRVTA